MVTRFRYQNQRLSVESMKKESVRRPGLSQISEPWPGTQYDSSFERAAVLSGIEATDMTRPRLVFENENLVFQQQLGEWSKSFDSL